MTDKWQQHGLAPHCLAEWSKFPNIIRTADFAVDDTPALRHSAQHSRMKHPSPLGDEQLRSALWHTVSRGQTHKPTHTFDERQRHRLADHSRHLTPERTITHAALRESADAAELQPLVGRAVRAGLGAARNRPAGSERARESTPRSPVSEEHGVLVYNIYIYVFFNVYS